MSFIHDNSGGVSVAGAPVLLSTAVALADATLEISANIDDTYDEYLIKIIDLIPSVNQSQFRMRMSTDGGSTFKAGGSDYQWVTLSDRSSGGTTEETQNIDGQIRMNPDSGGHQHGTGTGENANMKILLPNPSGVVLYKAMTYTYGMRSDDGGVNTGRGAGAYKGDLNAIDALQFFFDTGNIASGIFKLYGLV